MSNRDKVYTVYILAPVNVRVRARTDAEARARALRAVNPPGRGGRGPQELNTDDAEAVYLDDGIQWDLDPKHPEAIRHDNDAGLPVVNPVRGRKTEVRS